VFAPYLHIHCYSVAVLTPRLQISITLIGFSVHHSNFKRYQLHKKWHTHNNSHTPKCNPIENSFNVSMSHRIRTLTGNYNLLFIKKRCSSENAFLIVVITSYIYIEVMYWEVHIEMYLHHYIMSVALFASPITIYYTRTRIKWAAEFRRIGEKNQVFCMNTCSSHFG